MDLNHIRFHPGRYVLDAHLQYFSKDAGPEYFPEALTIRETIYSDLIRRSLVMYRPSPKTYITGLRKINGAWLWGDLFRSERRYLLVNLPDEVSVLNYWRKSFILIVFPDFHPATIEEREHFNLSFIDHFSNLMENDGPSGNPARNTFDSFKARGYE
jgi:hypothetical protein